MSTRSSQPQTEWQFRDISYFDSESVNPDFSLPGKKIKELLLVDSKEVDFSSDTYTCLAELRMGLPHNISFGTGPQGIALDAWHREKSESMLDTQQALEQW